MCSWIIYYIFDQTVQFVYHLKINVLMFLLSGFFFKAASGVKTLELETAWLADGFLLHWLLDQCWAVFAY